ncbi:hypothetical protein [Rubrivivax gelatinosus]|uniref:hypothetical protein n=1 Tax=Rubrivivax gelatinosus TaxID=28068 RepID=UPI001ED97937|nr:hypothetical protein [Rubrivivax gelatinosus]
MLRALAALLIGANLLFFAWARGWLDPAVPPPQHGQREPARLAAQIQPETIRIVTPQAASAAAASVACVEAGPFNDADAASAEQALIATGLPGDLWKRRDQAQPSVWLVYIGRFPDGASTAPRCARAPTRCRSCVCPTRRWRRRPSWHPASCCRATTHAKTPNAASPPSRPRA